MSTSVMNMLIEKLSNNIEEIRIFALRDINGKLKNLRADDFVYNGPFLLKSLIRWFGNVPLKEEGLALETILLVLSSSSAGDIIHILKADRILHELNKIEFFVHQPEHLKCLNEIRRKVSMMEFNDSKANDLNLDLNLSTLTEGLNIKGESTEAEQDAVTHMTKCWELPGTIDLNRMTSIKQSCLHPGTGESSLRETLAMLPVMISDMPGEYFLQPPYLYRNMLQLLVAQPDLTKTIQLLNKNLTWRIKYRQLAATYVQKDERDAMCCNQVSIAKYIMDCFKSVLVQFKAALSSNATIVNECLAIFSQIVEMAIQDPYGEKTAYDELTAELSELCRHFRLAMGVNENKDFVSRKYYLQILNELVILIRRRNSAGSINYYSNDFQEHDSESAAANQCENAWLSEVQVALLDVTIKIIYPQLYESIVNSVNVARLRNSSVIRALLHCDSELNTTVKVLRDWEEYSSEELIFLAPDALALLSIHESSRLILVLLKSIYSLNGKFCSDPKLRRASEKVFLQLLSNPDINLKRIVYQEAAKYMKMFFSSIVDGDRSVAKLQKDAEKSTACCNLGMPLTTEVLTEILSVGYSHNDGQITAQSEAILTLIVKGRNVLGRYWRTVQRVLIPILPLLQAITNSYSSLGKSILEMFDPDPMELPFNEIMLGNIRFMFNEDSSIRSEALVRLMYIVDSRPEAKDYTPDVRKLADSIHDDICILEAAVDVSRRFCGEGHFDETAIYSLVNVLKDDNLSNKSVRKSALMQLNSIAMDPKMNMKIHDLDAWYSILVVMDNAMKVNGEMDCPESAIPAVNIFSKMCIQIPTFRQEMAKEIKILILLFRSICKYHHMATFRPDCVLALFLLSHTDFVVGSINLSTPLLFSKLLLPFVVKSYHWIESPNYKASKFEESVASILEKRDLQSAARISRSDSASLYDFKMKLSAGTNRSLVSDCSESETLAATEIDAMWQFLRISFASLWFKGFDKLTESPSNMLNFASIGNPLDFNENLKITQADMSLIVSTMPINAFKWSISTIQSATSHTDVVNSLMTLKCVLKLNPNVKFSMKLLAKSLQRFCITIPCSPMDEDLFGKVVSFLTQALDSSPNGVELQSWAIKEFKQSHCNFVSLLTRRTSRDVFESNAKFVKRLLNCLVDSQRTEAAKKIALTLMNHVLDGIHDRYERSELEYVTSMLLILRVVLNRLPCLLEDYSEQFALNLADRLLAYSVTSKILSRTGSALLKNSLSVICKLGRVIPKFAVDKKHYKLIVGLTGHVDVEIRVLAWNLLEKLSSHLETAKLLPEELVDFPGGLYNFALSTALNENEADLVRETAAFVIGNLFSHVDPAGQIIICPELTDGEIPWDLVVELLNRHQVVDRMIEFIHVFSPTTSVDIEKSNDRLTYCGTIRGFVAILNSLMRLDASILGDIFVTSTLGLEMLNVINVVPADVTPDSLEMTAEICKFLLSAEGIGSDSVRERIIQTNQSVVGALVYLLNVHIYTSSLFGANLWKYSVYFLAMLRQIISTDQGYGVLCQVLEQNSNGRDFLDTLLLGLRVDGGDEGMHIGIMNFLRVALQAALNQDPPHMTVLTMMELECGAPIQRKIQPVEAAENDRENMDPNKPPPLKTLNRVGQMNAVAFSRLLFDEINLQFGLNCHSKNGVKSSPKKTACLKVLSVFLNVSKEARLRAKDSGLYEQIISRFRETIESLGSSSCAEFVRRHGEVKKIPIVEEFGMLFDILIGWFSTESLLDLEQVEAFSQLVIKSWSWMATNQKLQLKFVRLLVILSEGSVPVCKSFARQYSTVSPSVVQLLCQIISQEMAKVKHPKFNILLLRSSIRVLINCCCCIEGRILLGKLNVMDHMDRLHPQVTRWQEPWLQITELLFEFWEVYSRYPEGARLSHQNLLFALIHKSKTPKITVKALTILRNTTFNLENRSSLLNSEDYVNMIKYVLDSEAPNEQIMLVIVSVWKLLANSFKAKNKLKGTTIPNKLISLKNRFSVTRRDCAEYEDEILLILDIVNSILSN